MWRQSVDEGSSRMAGWPEDAESCRNCTGSPDRYAHGANGYCSRCCRLLRRIKNVKAWDRHRPYTLKGMIPKDGMFNPAVETYRTSKRLLTDRYTDDEFEVVRKEYIRQYEARLNLLRYREEVRRLEFPVDALQLEQQFARLLRLIRRKAAYPMNASYLNSHFNETERRVIYALLEEIMEQAPWQGISWGTVIEKISAYRQRKAADYTETRGIHV
jgi:hypothetical protein